MVSADRVLASSLNFPAFGSTVAMQARSDNEGKQCFSHKKNHIRKCRTSVWFLLLSYMYAFLYCCAQMPYDACKKNCRIRNGSFFANSKLYLQQWFILMHWWERQYHVTQAAEEAKNVSGVCYPGIPVPERHP